MLFISLLLAVAIKQFWEPNNPLHHDGWLSHVHRQWQRTPWQLSSQQHFALTLASIGTVVILISWYLEQAYPGLFILCRNLATVQFWPRSLQQRH